MKHIKMFNEAIKPKVKKEKNKKKIDPYYILTYNYMIGDSNGYTKEKCDISLNNPFLERYFKLLNSIKPVKGRWGVMLEEEVIYKAYKEGQINLDEHDFLVRIMFNSDSDYIIDEPDEEYAAELEEGVKSHTEYSFLVFQGLDLHYVDENGKKQEMEVD